MSMYNDASEAVTYVQEDDQEATSGSEQDSEQIAGRNREDVLSAGDEQNKDSLDDQAEKAVASYFNLGSLHLRQHPNNGRRIRREASPNTIMWSWTLRTHEPANENSASGIPPN